MSEHKQISSDANATDIHAHVASAPLRLLGVLYDGMLVLALLFLVSMVLIMIGTSFFGQVGVNASDSQTLPLWYKNFVQRPFFVLTLVGFYGVFWRKSGQTLGMQTWRLKTLSLDGRLLTWRQCFLRVICACILPFVCAQISFWLHKSQMAVSFSLTAGFLLNYLFCYVHKNGLALHDVLSRTTSVKIAKYQHKSVLQSLMSYFKNS